jgi:hypothetical protein
VPSGHTPGQVGVSNSNEPDAELAESIARRGCLLRGLVGSTVHGLSNPRTDDRHEMGVCVEPPQYIAGLGPFEHWVYRTQPEGAPSGPGDLDLTIYGLRKYCRMALKGSPTVLLILFIAGEHACNEIPSDRNSRRSRRRSSPNTRDARFWLRRRATARADRHGDTPPVPGSSLPSMAMTPNTPCTPFASPTKAKSCFTPDRITLPIASPERDLTLSAELDLMDDLS